MKKALIAAIGLQLLSVTLYAQLQLPAILQKPIEQALTQSREITNKQLDVQKVQMEQKSVLNKYVPTIEATAGYAYLNNNITLDAPSITLPITGIELFQGKTKMDNRANALHGGVMAKSNIFSGGQIQNGARALNQKAIGDSLLIETDKDNLIADVIESFDKLKLIEASAKLIEETDQRLRKEEERVEKGIQNGLAIPFDRDKIKLARLELESKRTELEESKKVLFEKLSYLTGMPEEELAAISYELSPFVLQDNLNVDNKQELEALKAYKNAADYLIKKEKGTYLPGVVAFAGASYTSLFDVNSNLKFPFPLPSQLPQPNLKLNQFTVAPNWMAGIALKWEIFGGFQRKHKVQEAEINKRQLENKLSDSRDKLNLLLKHKYSTYTTQWKQIDLANQQETIAKNNLVLAGKQYTQGLISISQRLEAENDYFKAGQRKTEVLINQRQAALEALMSTGKLSQQIQYK